MLDDQGAHLKFQMPSPQSEFTAQGGSSTHHYLDFYNTVRISLELLLFSWANEYLYLFLFIESHSYYYSHETNGLKDVVEVIN